MGDMEIDKAPEVIELQEDDEFEEFEGKQITDFEEVKVLDAWEEDWDDDIKQDNFAVVLKAEIANK
jgi:DSS1/SEM1 family